LQKAVYGQINPYSEVGVVLLDSTLPPPKKKHLMHAKN